MRRDPGLFPTPGVTASEVSSHTGFATGVSAPQLPGAAAISCVPFQHPCCPADPAVADPAVPSTDCGASRPMKFCLLIILTHLKANAFALFKPGMSAFVSAGLVK